MGHRIVCAFCLAVWLLPTSDSWAVDEFGDVVRPFVKQYCTECHGEKTQEAKLDLSRFDKRSDLSTFHQTWDEVIARIEAGEMPPEESVLQPKADERKRVVAWLKAARDEEARAKAGDPGIVLLRRLSNSEYDNTIRDLTGVDIRPTRTFPVDPANEAGFDNSGESLAVSPALFAKYLQAAREVADHVVLTPTELLFAPHPAVTDTDRDKFCVKRIVQFYDRQPTDLSEYFAAAHGVRVALSEIGLSGKQQPDRDKVSVMLEEASTRHRVSPRYLRSVWQILNDRPGDNDRPDVEQQNLGPVVALQGIWSRFAGTARDSATCREQCQRMESFVKEFRLRIETSVENLELQSNHKGSQPFVLWKNRQYAAYRRTLDSRRLPSVDDTTVSYDFGGPIDDLVSQSLRFSTAQQPALVAAVERFCSVFPDAFYISERGRDYVGKSRDEQEKGRLLSAGFHSMMGYFRDDEPLYELVLSETERQEIDRLWAELDLVASSASRQYVGFLWFERTDSRYMRDPEFDFSRAEDKEAQSSEMIKRLARVYRDKAIQNDATPVILAAIDRYFDDINRNLRWVETTSAAAEPLHLQGVLQFAERAYRRSLSSAEVNELGKFYRELRDADGLDHESAIRDSIVAILMSPHFMFRVDLGGSGDATRELTDNELANRLAYFLWSSMPDASLRATAGRGGLGDPDLLAGEALRMMRDERIEGMAANFAGNWLDFRRFEEHNAVDLQRFSSFDDNLRSAMFDEPIRFFVDVVQNDRSVLSFLNADYTFVNRDLATHYGFSTIPEEGVWEKVLNANDQGRGGVLPMAVFLTKNSPGLRTSPVKRGYWVARRLLGERIPPPPPNVPDLPDDESKFEDQSLREMLARHRDNKSCAGCHDRFDTLGLVFENYGPIGERREVDLSGREVNTAAVLPGGTSVENLDGLKNYLTERRRDEYLDNLCRKFLAFALGRTLIRSDDMLILEMRAKLEQDDYRFGAMVETIIRSSQFRTKRTPKQIVIKAEEQP